MFSNKKFVSMALGAVLALALLPGCGGDDDGGDGGDEPGNALTIDALDSLDFDKDAYKATAGTIEIEYVHDGTVPHDLLIEGYEDELLLEVAGDTDTGSIDLPEGDYVIYCSIAGHREAGMEATLTVVAAAG